MIVFNEKEYIGNIIKNHDKTTIRNKYSLIKMLVKYYYPDFKDKTVKDFQQFVLSKLAEFQFSAAEYEEWEYCDFVKSTCRNALSGSMNIYLRDQDYIEITQNEMDLIAKAKTMRERKFLFTLYVLAKLYNYRSGWVNYKDSEIFKLANIHLSLKERDYLIFSLKTQGLLQLNHIAGQCGYKVELDDDSPVALKVDMEKWFGNQYVAHIKGKKWIMCKDCGRVVKKNSNSQCFCKRCAAKHK